MQVVREPDVDRVHRGVGQQGVIVAVGSVRAEFPREGLRAVQVPRGHGGKLRAAALFQNGSKAAGDSAGTQDSKACRHTQFLPYHMLMGVIILPKAAKGKRFFRKFSKFQKMFLFSARFQAILADFQ